MIVIDSGKPPVLFDFGPFLSRLVPRSVIRWFQNMFAQIFEKSRSIVNELHQKSAQGKKKSPNLVTLLVRSRIPEASRSLGRSAAFAFFSLFDGQSFFSLDLMNNA